MTRRLRDDRHMVLSAYPWEPGRLRTIFTPGEGSVRNLIESPPYLRYGGWNLPLNRQADIVRGEFLKVESSDYRTLRVYRDGTTVFAARADGDFLAWSSPAGESRINPVALIESVYNFSNFYSLVLTDFEQRPDAVCIRVDLQNLHLDGVRTYLLPGDAGSRRYRSERDRKEAPDDSVTRLVEFATTTLTPAAVAFKVVREIYLWFGFEEDKIPYTAVKNGQRTIDVEQILRLGG